MKTGISTRFVVKSATNCRYPRRDLKQKYGIILALNFSSKYGSSGDCTYLRPDMDHCQHKGNRRTLDVELIQMMCVKDPAISPKEPNWFSPVAVAVAFAVGVAVAVGIVGFILCCN
ncbi:hypothetical protein GQX74_010926 [Glossina fuscipes]|nr:hypothetical protein GQX74_010926 [Glossina fuscipes]